MLLNLYHCYQRQHHRDLLHQAEENEQKKRARDKRIKNTLVVIAVVPLIKNVYVLMQPTM